MSRKSDENKSCHHGHKGHMWMMAICCGLPIAGFLAIAILGVSLPSLETLFLLLCPIGMIGMMYFMHRDNCASSNKEEDTKLILSQDHASTDPTGSGKEPDEVNVVKIPGSLKA